jgi:hypothetical protein
MTLHDLPAARMLGRRVHIALTCHLPTTRLLRLAHHRVRHQTVSPRYSQKKEEHRCSDDLVKQLHSAVDIFTLTDFSRRVVRSKKISFTNTRAISDFLFLLLSLSQLPSLKSRMEMSISWTEETPLKSCNWLWCKVAECWIIAIMAAAGKVEALFKGRQFDQEIIVLCVRWYLRYKLSTRDLATRALSRSWPFIFVGIDFDRFNLRPNFGR